jgi:hypothetical protein
LIVDRAVAKRLMKVYRSDDLVLWDKQRYPFRVAK